MSTAVTAVPTRHQHDQSSPVRGRRWSVPAARAGRVASSLLLVTAMLAFVVLAVGPHLFGYRTATMLTGSMAPGIVPGDVVVAFPEPASEVAVGDVISYHIPVGDHRVETHRVIEVLRHHDSIAVRTQGDANDGADPWTASLEGDTVWQVRAVVPYVGGAIRTLRTPVLNHTLMYGIPALLVGWALVSIWRRPVRR